MAQVAMTALATHTLSTNSTGVTFGSIPSSYKDLVVTVSGACTSTDNVGLQFNGSNSGYQHIYIYGGPAKGATTATSRGQVQLNDYTFWNTPESSAVATIFDYADTSKNKFTLVQNNQPSAVTERLGSMWANTSAITSVRVFAVTNFAAGTTISIFGITG